MLQGRVLFQKLDDGVVSRLFPVEHDCDLHNEFASVTLCPVLRQDEVDVHLLTHPVNSVDQVLFLYLACLNVLLLSQVLETLLFRLLLLFAVLVFVVVVAQSRRSLHLSFLSRLDCLKGIQDSVKLLVLVLLVTHLDALGRRLNQLIHRLNLVVALRVARNQRLQRVHVGCVLHNGRAICIPTCRVHLLVVSSCVIIMICGVGGALEILAHPHLIELSRGQVR